MAKAGEKDEKRTKRDVATCGILDAVCFMREGPQKRFIEPRLLYLIRKEPSYGYQLMGQIDKLPFPGPAPDSAAVYRMLRELEKQGFMQSDWQPGESGPSKRIYRITEAGRRRLDVWVDEFKARVSLLNSFIRMCEEK